MSTTKDLQTMFEAGVHFGYNKASRHPSVKDHVFGTKDGVQIIDLEKTNQSITEATDFLKELASTSSKVVFVGSKNESKSLIKDAATSLGMGYVNTRWVGGTFTNFAQIKKRIQKLEKMLDQREKGEFAKYTKKEQLMLDREIAKLQKNYGGLMGMTELPKAIIVIDSDYETIAVKEAIAMNIPVIAISNTDCDIREIKYPIVANDSTRKSVEFLVGMLTAALKTA